MPDRLEGRGSAPAPGGAESHLDSTKGRHHDASVRTTITLEPDVAEQLERAARVSGKTFKTTVNEALRIGLGLTGKSIEPPRFQIRSFVNGLQPGIDPDKMNQLLDQLEAEDVARKHQG